MNAAHILNEYKKKISAGKKGFTLVELLVVIAVIGILATVIILAINPLEQLARTRDAGRKSGVAQVANAIQAYFTSHDGVYPTTGADTYMNTLITAGEMKQVPAAITLSPAFSSCSDTGGDIQNGYCYVVDPATAQFVLYTRLESNSEHTQTSAAAGTTAGGSAFSGNCPTGKLYFAYASASGKSCRVCLGAAAANTALVAGQTCN